MGAAGVGLETAPLHGLPVGGVDPVRPGRSLVRVVGLGGPCRCGRLAPVARQAEERRGETADEAAHGSTALTAPPTSPGCSATYAADGCLRAGTVTSGPVNVGSLSWRAEGVAGRIRRGTRPVDSDSPGSVSSLTPLSGGARGQATREEIGAGRGRRRHRRRGAELVPGPAGPPAVRRLRRRRGGQRATCDGQQAPGDCLDQIGEPVRHGVEQPAAGWAVRGAGLRSRTAAAAVSAWRG